MKTPICDLLGVELPIFAFSHSREVVAEVTLAGGCGVFGAALFSPDELDEHLTWIDSRVGGRTYGVDVIIPNSFAGKDDPAAATSANGEVPADIRDFVDGILRDHDIDPASVTPVRVASTESMSSAWTERIIDISINHRVGFLVNALGTPPPWMMDRARDAEIPVGALVGTKRHALAQVEAGLDFIVAQGTEAGGHTGTVGTMVIVPEIVSAVKQLRDIPVLAAGGIATGRQMAAAMALGADGAWTGSVWLATQESEVPDQVKRKMLGAASSDTVRSRHRTGKPSRQLRSSWHDAWSREGSPEPLPMPLMGYVSEPALRRADVLAEEGHAGAQRLSSYWVGQAVGLMNELQSCREVMGEFEADYARAVGALVATLDAPPSASTSASSQ